MKDIFKYWRTKCFSRKTHIHALSYLPPPLWPLWPLWPLCYSRTAKLLNLKNSRVENGIRNASICVLKISSSKVLLLLGSKPKFQEDWSIFRHSDTFSDKKQHKRSTLSLRSFEYFVGYLCDNAFSCQRQNKHNNRNTLRLLGVTIVMFLPKEYS